MDKVIELDVDLRFKDPFNDEDKFNQWILHQDYLQMMFQWMSQEGYTFTVKDSKYLYMLDAIDSYLFIHDRSKVNNKYVWVFGSNLAGVHGNGAALTAKRYFNAKQGVGEGISDDVGLYSSYALPTKDERIQTLSLDSILEHIRVFIEQVSLNPTTFYSVTRVGCGLAGILDSTIINLFKQSLVDHGEFKGRIPDNLSLPAQWAKTIRGDLTNVMSIYHNDYSFELPEINFSNLTGVISEDSKCPMEEYSIAEGFELTRIPSFKERFGKDAPSMQRHEILRRSTKLVTKVAITNVAYAYTLMDK